MSARPSIVLVAARAANGVIGRGGALPWRLPDDLARFKRITLGKPVVMGRKTYESIGRPLPGRANLVLSARGARFEGCETFGSVDEVLARASDVSELCVIGGAEIYRAFLPIADRLELTEVEADVEGDAYFPPLDLADFTRVSSVPHAADARHAHTFRFDTYERARE